MFSSLQIFKSEHLEFVLVSGCCGRGSKDACSQYKCLRHNSCECVSCVIAFLLDSINMFANYAEYILLRQKQIEFTSVASFSCKLPEMTSRYEKLESSAKAEMQIMCFALHDSSESF